MADGSAREYHYCRGHPPPTIFGDAQRSPIFQDESVLEEADDLIRDEMAKRAGAKFIRFG